jgi:uncharacterized protein (TIGR03437 family)
MRAVLVFVAIMFPSGALAQSSGIEQWFSAWTVAQGAHFATSMSGTSVRMIVRPTISGSAVRVRLENRFGQSPVMFSAAYIGQVQSGAALVAGSNTQLTFSGKPGLTLAAGAGAYSDPVTFQVAAFTRYAISLDVTTAADISAHVLGLVTNYMAMGAHAADSTAISFTAVPDDGANTDQGPQFPFYWVAAVDVASPSNTGTVVTLGDSITDGHCSTRTDNGAFDGTDLPDLYNRWPDLLAMRFAALPASQSKAVANEGISGNTVVAPPLAGPPAVARLANDVLGRSGATHVILFEGTNDIGSESATSAVVIAGDQQIIDNAHAAGLKIIGATLIPRGGEGAWTSFQEQQRVALNDWIRHQANFDAVIDFDKLMQGSVNAKNGLPAIPPQWGCWDGVHPNSSGYAEMAASIDLSLFNTTPAIQLVANAEGEAPSIAPNTWIEIKGSTLAPPGYSSPACAPGYCWQTSDFVNNKMPTQLDNVSATVNGKSAYVYYISPTQVNILTPPDAMSGPVQVVITNNGTPSATFTAQAQPVSPSFFVFDGTHVAATHVNGSLLGPASLYPGSTMPAKPGETVVLYANGFGLTSTPVVSGSPTQGGTLSPLPIVKIGETDAMVQFAGLVAPGEFQFNVVVPASTPDGDQPIVATYNGLSTQSGTLITVQH